MGSSLPDLQPMVADTIIAERVGPDAVALGLIWFDCELDDLPSMVRDDIASHPSHRFDGGVLLAVPLAHFHQLDAACSDDPGVAVDYRALRIDADGAEVIDAAWAIVAAFGGNPARLRRRNLHRLTEHSIELSAAHGLAAATVAQLVPDGADTDVAVSSDTLDRWSATVALAAGR